MSRAPAVAGKRRDADAYPTPLWVTRRLLEALAPLVPKGATFFEPCAGRGHIVRAIAERYPDAPITAWELNEPAESPTREVYGAATWSFGDSLRRPWPKADVCVMNPPFSAAEDFAEKALASGIPVVAVLERIAWATAARSRTWLRDRTPSLLILPQRPSFAHCCYYGPGKADFVLTPYDMPSPEGTIRRRASADMAEYAWFVWEPSNASRVVILPDTSLEERKEGQWKAPK